MYSGPAGLAGYAWSVISGDAAIVGSIDSQTVNVTQVMLVVYLYYAINTTGANGCTSTCTKTLTIADTQKPVITAIGTPTRYFRL
jgi:hypothetical protein